ncbi:hypothetical protein AVHM3334_19525 [Acidovorax sp. SUPP3334]|nr:hypothetical protein AVHM3334_19525 [Acidovorax sp. SUPP3334]
MLLVSRQIDDAFERDVQGIDLVVGAKGSPLQLILAGVFHIDVPPGNIALADFEALARQPLVAEAIPLSLGDSFAGYRIVGTTPQYPAHYGAALAQGRLWQQPMEAVLGAAVARAMASASQDAAPGQGDALLGRRFVGSHGLAGGGHAHGAHPYTVAGVLAPCGCVLDRLVLTATESVWKVHESAQADDPDDLEALRQEREVTLALVRYRSPLAAVTLPRTINANTPMQAAAPAVEVTRLLRLLGVGADVLQAFGAVLLGVAALSVFIALWNAVRERRADLAMLRMLGTSRARGRAAAGRGAVAGADRLGPGPGRWPCTGGGGRLDAAGAERHARDRRAVAARGMGGARPCGVRGGGGGAAAGRAGLPGGRGRAAGAALNAWMGPNSLPFALCLFLRRRLLSVTHSF